MSVNTSFKLNKPAKVDHNVVVSEVTVDFTKATVLASEEVQVMKIPAGALVDKVWGQVTTAMSSLTGACAFSIGDGSSVTTWNAQNINAKATGLTVGSVSNVYYSADNYLTIVPSTNVPEGVVKVGAQYSIIGNN